MTTHPIDTEALRDAVRDHEPDDHGPGKCGLDDCFTSCVECGEDWPCLWSSLPDLLAAVEHRATRAEAQSAIRGRAVVMYRERAREAEAERDEWKALALQERGAALDTLGQIKARDARIKAVRDVLDAADDRGPIGLTFDGTPFPAFVSSADIRRALDA